MTKMPKIPKKPNDRRTGGAIKIRPMTLSSARDRLAYSAALKILG